VAFEVDCVVPYGEGTWWTDSSSVSVAMLEAPVLCRVLGLCICLHTASQNQPSLIC